MVLLVFVMLLWCLWCGMVLNKWLKDMLMEVLLLLLVFFLFMVECKSFCFVYYLFVFFFNWKWILVINMDRFCWLKFCNFMSWLILYYFGIVILYNRILLEGCEVVYCIFEFIKRELLIDVDDVNGWIFDRVEGNLEFWNVDFVYFMRLDVFIL